MNTNEVQNEVEARGEIRELTVAELERVGGGNGVRLGPNPPTNQ